MPDLASGHRRGLTQDTFSYLASLLAHSTANIPNLTAQGKVDSHEQVEARSDSKVDLGIRSSLFARRLIGLDMIGAPRSVGFKAKDP